MDHRLSRPTPSPDVAARTSTGGSPAGGTGNRILFTVLAVLCIVAGASVAVRLVEGGLGSPLRPTDTVVIP